MSEKFKILRVTLTQDYHVPMYDDKQSKINGWTIKELIKDWFYNRSLAASHATRDSHKIGFSETILKIEDPGLPPEAPTDNMNEGLLCNCMTKTPDPKYHKEDCPIRNMIDDHLELLENGLG